MFNSEDQCLFRLPEFVIWCWCVREERIQTLLRGIVNLWDAES